MPLKRVQQIHKFGIISHSQRLALQERLLKNSYLQTIESRKTLAKSRNTLEVTEDFVQLYNDNLETDLHSKYEIKARKMLERIKRRCGLKDAGVGQHVDLPLAWTEVAQLSQCKGQIQEDCLDILISSLDQAPFYKENIPALFYLAETTLYWLRTESFIQPYLRAGEIKLLRSGSLVFMRLFYHHMSGQLQDKYQFKNRLFTYLDGFIASQDLYSPYPNALLYMRYINEVGKMIVGESYDEAGEVKEGDNLTDEMVEKIYQDMLDHGEDTQEVSAQNKPRASSVASGAISSSVHDLSPTLWHSLDVWRCVHNPGAGLDDAIKALIHCSQGLANENWADVMCAFVILGEAARIHIEALKAIQSLASAWKPSHATPQTTNSTAQYMSQDGQTVMSQEKQKHTPFTLTTENQQLSDIYEKSEEYSSYKSTLKSRTSSKYTQATNPKYTEDERIVVREGCTLTPAQPTQVNQQIEQMSSLPMNGDQSNQSQEKVTLDHGATMNVEIGSRISGRDSPASSVNTYTNDVQSDLPGIHSWHWEIAYYYAEMLADICIHSTSSSIQKVALLGMNKDISLLHKRQLNGTELPSTGLLDMVYFRAYNEKSDEGPNDWSWRVRYSAIQGLVKICRCCQNEPTKEGMWTVAWNTLVKAHSLERDIRVLEALKVGQVHAGIENQVKEHLVVPLSTLGSKIARGLACLYLPPLPSILPITKIRTPRGRKITVNHPLPKGVTRTSIKEEVDLATALYEPPVSMETRTDFNLHRIVEDQWRKELQQKIKDDEEDKLENLVKREREKVEQQIHEEQKRKVKLGKNYKGPLYNRTENKVK